MTIYAEAFRVNRVTYLIKGDPGGRLTVWRSGSMIAETKLGIDDARSILHGYAISQAHAEIGSAERQLIDATSTLERLGQDKFNLGRFRI